RNQDSAAAVPRDDGGCHFLVKSKALGDDVRRVVGAMLERGPREQPTHDFGVVGLQVQRHIRGHPELAADQIGRAGLVHLPRDSVQYKPCTASKPVAWCLNWDLWGQATLPGSTR